MREVRPHEELLNDGVLTEFEDIIRGFWAVRAGKGPRGSQGVVDVVCASVLLEGPLSAWIG